MINNVVLVGRLTKDPELKYTQSGIAVTRFTLAVNRTFTNQQGQREADFINCITWRKQAENTANFLNKGSLAGIEGRIQTSNFEGKDGNRIFMTEILVDRVQFLEPKGSRVQEGYHTEYDGQQYDTRANATSQQQYQNNKPSGPPMDVGDDDLPF